MFKLGLKCSSQYLSTTVLEGTKIICKHAEIVTEKEQIMMINTKPPQYLYLLYLRMFVFAMLRKKGENQGARLTALSLPLTARQSAQRQCFLGVAQSPYSYSPPMNILNTLKADRCDSTIVLLHITTSALLRAHIA